MRNGEGEDFIIYHTKGPFPPVAKERGKGAKHLLSRGMKDGHLKEMHGSPRMEHTPWREMKAF